MKIEEYLRQYPNVKLWNLGGINEGLLQFDDTASYFAGPFPGNFVYFRISTEPNSNQPTIEEFLLKHRLSRFNFPKRLGFKQDAESETHLQKRLTLLTLKERKEWDLSQIDVKIHYPTKENPYKFWLAGNDDCSYTKFFPSLEESQKELNKLEQIQPLNFQIHVKQNGFVFTN